MGGLNDYLLPEGFREFISFANSKETKILKSKEIQNGLSHLYGFSSGKVAGIIKRAEEKQLISKISRGVYQYNGNDGKLKTFSIAEPERDLYNEQSLQDKINQEIMQTTKRINEILALEIDSLSVQDFEKIKAKIDALKEIANK